jgi:ABC-type uncharacterized transport system substrate-binding protein
MKLAAPAAGVALIGVEFGSSSDVDAALAVMLRERTQVLLVSNDPLHQLHVSRIIEFLAKSRIAGMLQSKENVVAGGLMAYGASLPDLFRRAAAYGHRILQGANLLTCRSNCQPNSIWRSTSGLPARSASICRRCSSLEPTR